jgi:Amt family ammonium transporter
MEGTNATLLAACGALAGRVAKLEELAAAGAGAAAEATTHGRVLLQTNETIDLLTEEVVGVNLAIDTLWQLLAAFMVFLMQAGFAALEAGSVRAKNTKNILLKNLLDACLGAVVWWALGFPFAFGTRFNGSNGWIGANNFFLAQYNHVLYTTAQPRYNIELVNFGRTGGDPDGLGGVNTDEAGLSGYAFWMFQWAFAATTATIVSGAVAERCRFVGYLIYQSVLIAFVYPVVVHWVWSTEGWLSAFFVPPNTDGRGTCDGVCDNLFNGIVDFAGSGVVHLVGGTAALWSAYILGPRIGRFGSNGEVNDLQPHSLPLATLGVLIMWFGWYGFNCGSTLALANGLWYVAAKVAVVTTLSAAGGGCGTVILGIIMRQPIDLAPVLNGILSGLVACCAGTATFEPFAGLVVGLVASWLYAGASAGLKKLRIDDPLDASPVHLVNGAWGLIAAGLLSTRTNTIAAYGNPGPTNQEPTDFIFTDSGHKYWGGFYDGGGRLFGAQVIAMLAIFAWVSIVCIPLFGILKITGLFRVSEEEEVVGMDISHHGGSAYEWQMPDGDKTESRLNDDDEKPSPPPPGEPGDTEDTVTDGAASKITEG